MDIATVSVVRSSENSYLTEREKPRHRSSVYERIRVLLKYSRLTTEASEFVYKMADRKPKFTFQPVEGKKFGCLEDKDNKDLLTKW